jgi:hypothetical protein
MKKLLIMAAIVLVSGTALALSDQTTSKPQQQAAETPQLPASQQPENSTVTSLKSPDGVLQSVPVAQSNSNQLIRNLPYRSKDVITQKTDASNRSTAQSGSQPNQLTAPDGFHQVVCLVGGIEQKNITSDECKSKGGMEVVTREVSSMASPGTGQKY